MKNLQRKNLLTQNKNFYEIIFIIRCQELRDKIREILQCPRAESDIESGFAESPKDIEDKKGQIMADITAYDWKGYLESLPEVQEMLQEIKEISYPVMDDRKKMLFDIDTTPEKYFWDIFGQFIAEKKINERSAMGFAMDAEKIDPVLFSGFGWKDLLKVSGAISNKLFEGMTNVLDDAIDNKIKVISKTNGWVYRTLDDKIREVRQKKPKSILGAFETLMNME